MPLALYYNEHRPTPYGMESAENCRTDSGNTMDSSLRQRMVDDNSLKSRQKKAKDSDAPDVFKYKEQSKRIDYVLVYEKKALDEVHDAEDRADLKMRLDYRDRFEECLQIEGIDVQKEVLDENVFLKLHTPFNRLCQEADAMKLELPLKGVSSILTTSTVQLT